MKKFLIPLIPLLLLPISLAQVITIGVMPSEINAHMGINHMTFKFFNTHGEVDAYYYIQNSPEVECLENCKVLVRRGTTIQEPEVYTIKVNVKNSGYLYITAKPVNVSEEEGTVSIIQRVGVKVNCLDCRKIIEEREKEVSGGSSKSTGIGGNFEVNQTQTFENYTEEIKEVVENISRNNSETISGNISENVSINVTEERKSESPIPVPIIVVLICLIIGLIVFIFLG